jgi:hypothetical protein
MWIGCFHDEHRHAIGVGKLREPGTYSKPIGCPVESYLGSVRGVVLELDQYDLLLRVRRLERHNGNQWNGIDGCP